MQAKRFPAWLSPVAGAKRRSPAKRDLTTKPFPYGVAAVNSEDRGGGFPSLSPGIAGFIRVVEDSKDMQAVPLPFLGGRDWRITFDRNLCLLREPEGNIAG